ncbi:GntR family transcriptional regulator [Pseudonocardia sp. ICBG1034]|uniref:GntR family transcriptional regulator n=1 Tax=Pseudonocardia sp. ICBG1034 TaxID=2844381 RepID=UPI001CCA77A2|nr:GntR family transcriptional regulator [Pseudonocardia sp. ICBG1034]
MEQTEASTAVVPGLRITDPRRISVEVHTHLRQLIVTGALPAGTELKQAELARAFAVSRAPLREAFRMLQEEGLVSAEPNRRSVVLGFDPAELELLYAARIALESLGVRITAGRLTTTEAKDAGAALREMERAHRAADMGSWSAAHHRFHRVVVVRCGSRVTRTIASYAEQSEPYVRAYQADHADLFPDRHREHTEILTAVLDGDGEGGSALMATHLAGTALRVLGDFTPDHPAEAVRAAVAQAGAQLH